MSLMRALGFNFDAPHQRPTSVFAAPSEALLSDIRPWSIRRFCPPTPDQGPLGGCVGVSLVGSLKTLDNATNVPSALGSALAAYLAGRFNAWIASGAGAGIAPDKVWAAFVAQDSDTGTSHADACAGILQMGLPPDSAWTYDPADTGAPTDKFRMRPDSNAQRLGWDARVELVRLGIDDRSDTAKVLAINHAGMVGQQPTDIGILVDKPFVTEAFDPTVAYTPDTSKPEGGHALFIVEMRVNPRTGAREYLVAMSWGEGRFDFVWLSEACVLHPSTQLTIIQRAPALIEAT